MIRNITPAGAMVDAEMPTLLPRELLLLNVNEGMIYEAKIIWHRGSRLGLEFCGQHDVRKVSDPRFSRLKLLWVELSPR
jgi:hypothetical protein